MERIFKGFLEGIGIRYRFSALHGCHSSRLSRSQFLNKRTTVWRTTLIEVGPTKNFLAARERLCDNYVMRSTRNIVEAKEHAGTVRYSDPPLLVLASLANGPKHGHAMIEDIVRLSGTRLGPGTLYGAIARLEQQGLIKPLRPEERRQPYRITAEGVRVLRGKLTTLRQFSNAGLERLEAL